MNEQTTPNQTEGVQPEPVTREYGHLSLTKQRAIEDLRQIIANRLCDLEELCRAYNLHYDQITFIARSSKFESGIIVVTNESAEGLKAACQQALDPDNIAPDFQGGTE